MNKILEIISQEESFSNQKNLRTVNKNCEKPTISNNNFILPFETKYIPKAKNKKEEKPLVFQRFF